MFEKNFNITNIALIPKEKGAKELKDFRAISLVGSFYKVISKVLTERLKRVADSSDGSQQRTFITGRQIMGTILIANEFVDSRTTQGKLAILCELDIEKAYDPVNWGFMLSVLRQTGFGKKWINQVKFSISTMKFSILINGVPEGLFDACRGY